MSIKSSKELKRAIKEVTKGKSELIYDIAQYVALNSMEDKESNRVYKEFEKKHPEHFIAVEMWVNFLLKKQKVK